STFGGPGASTSARTRPSPGRTRCTGSFIDLRRAKDRPETPERPRHPSCAAVLRWPPASALHVQIIHTLIPIPPTLARTGAAPSHADRDALGAVALGVRGLAASASL